MAWANSTFIASSVQHLIRHCVHHNQWDGAKDTADVVTEVRCCFFFSSGSNSDNEPPGTKKLKKQKQRRKKFVEKFVMNHPIYKRIKLTKNDETMADKRFLREMMFTSNHIHIWRLSTKFDIVNYFCLQLFLSLIRWMLLFSVFSLIQQNLLSKWCQSRRLCSWLSEDDIVMISACFTTLETRKNLSVYFKRNWKRSIFLGRFHVTKTSQKPYNSLFTNHQSR